MANQERSTSAARTSWSRSAIRVGIGEAAVRILEDIGRVSSDVVARQATLLGACASGRRSVLITPDSADPNDAAIALLTGKGFTVQYSSEVGADATASLQSDRWDVLMSSSDVGGELTTTYIVAPRSS
ncbi:hypothetical protein C6I20_02035 [Aeromicrobium sp. A1-2]|uniref:hypothetical protein n=1 Tax=Aeromicrobium sp. A1-2 TaxID=2107713 RepID=UPI000E4C8508|nr:hypothetical protein [Aeromicrobium sp. A1-2]AXT84094.1 hypothetical protein C6I20_02035 [Aeromicrobium sp. A1-2]